MSQKWVHQVEFRLWNKYVVASVWEAPKIWGRNDEKVPVKTILVKMEPFRLGSRISVCEFGIWKSFRFLHFLLRWFVLDLSKNFCHGKNFSCGLKYKRHNLIKRSSVRIWLLLEIYFHYLFCFRWPSVRRLITRWSNTSVKIHFMIARKFSKTFDLVIELISDRSGYQN